MTEIKRRIQMSVAEKRVHMEQVTRAVFEENEKRRAMNAQKTVRLRALRLAALEIS